MVTSEAFLLLHAADEASLQPLVSRVGDRLPGFSRFSAGGFTLFARDPSRVIPVPPNGLLFGRIFPRRGPPRPMVAFNGAETDALRRSPGTTLARDFWGNYLLALDESHTPAVFRAPLGHLPCFASRMGQCRIFSSDLATLRQSGLLRAQVDWRGVARALYRRDLPGPLTAIETVSELLPGVSRSWSGAGDRDQPFWSPWDHIGEAPARDTLAERLRREVQNTTAALTHEFGGVLLGASGGLDSSVLACCLADARRGCTVLTMATTSPEGDERGFARAIARAIDRPLIERFYDAARIDLDASISTHLPRPAGWIHEAAYNAVVRDEAARVGAGAFVSGNGGDNAFYNSMSARPLVDSLLARRTLAASARTAADVAAVTGATFGAVARETWRVWQRRRRPYAWTAAADLLAPDLIADLEGEGNVHPWLTRCSAPPGKIGHVAMLLRMQNHLGGFDPEWRLPVLNPLATQPVVELCLGVPSWAWIRGGRDRQPVRDAFAGALPPLVAERRSKGSPNEVVLRLLQDRGSEIAERLLDGLLVSHGIVDRARLATVLADEAEGEGADPLGLMSLLNAEAWAQTLA